MFTGIVEEAGTVERITPASAGIRLVVSAPRCLKDLKLGDSVAVNGCCLTVVGLGRKSARRTARFDLLQETWKRTSLQFLRPGSLVNLERPLPAHGRLDGHFVTGHIDGLGRITRWERAGADYVLEIQAPEEVQRYIVPKGSIAVDGISLTVAGLSRQGFRVWIIPHTRAVTALRDRQVGQAVNLEADILGKYVEKFLDARPRSSVGTRTRAAQKRRWS